jgi:hypothetical protein
MTSLRSAGGLRERAAKCRALAEGRITRLDASEWLRLAEEWERLADSVEAYAFRATMSEVARLPTIAADPSLSRGWIKRDKGN